MDQWILQILEKRDRNDEEVRELVESFSQLEFFEKFLQGVNPEVIHQIFKEATMESYQPKQKIFMEGDLSNSKMYVVVTGCVAIHIQQNINVFETENSEGGDKQSENGDVKALLHQGAHFGEKAILEKGGRRGATAIAQEMSHLLIISRSNYLQIKDNIDEEQRRIKTIMMDVIPELKKVSSPLILEQLAYSFTAVRHKKDDQVIREGDLGYEIH